MSLLDQNTYIQSIMSLQDEIKILKKHQVELEMDLRWAEDENKRLSDVLAKLTNT